MKSTKAKLIILNGGTCVLPPVSQKKTITISPKEILLSPLAYIDDPSEQAWAKEWLLDLLTSSRHFEKEDIIYQKNHSEKQITQALFMLSQQPKPWSLTALTMMPILDGNERATITQYTIDERGTGGLLDAEEESIIPHAIMQFDIAPLMDAKIEIHGIVLSYLLHRIEKIIENRATILVDPYVHRVIEKYLNTPVFKKKKLVVATLIEKESILKNEDVHNIQEKPSGKFLIRMPRSLHKDLIDIAKLEDVSLNTIVLTAAAKFVGYS